MITKVKGYCERFRWDSCLYGYDELIEHGEQMCRKKKKKEGMQGNIILKRIASSPEVSDFHHRPSWPPCST